MCPFDLFDEPRYWISEWLPREVVFARTRARTQWKAIKARINRTRAVKLGGMVSDEVIEA